jgi:hypothetical protein
MRTPTTRRLPCLWIEVDGVGARIQGTEPTTTEGIEAVREYVRLFRSLPADRHGNLQQGERQAAAIARVRRKAGLDP